MSPNFRKEVRIGLSLLMVLSVIFVVLLVRRISRSVQNEADAANIAAWNGAAKELQKQTTQPEPSLAERAWRKSSDDIAARREPPAPAAPVALQDDPLARPLAPPPPSTTFSASAPAGQFAASAPVYSGAEAPLAPAAPEPKFDAAVMVTDAVAPIAPRSAGLAPAANQPPALPAGSPFAASRPAPQPAGFSSVNPAAAAAPVPVPGTAQGMPPMGPSAMQPAPMAQPIGPPMNSPMAPPATSPMPRTDRFGPDPQGGASAASDMSGYGAAADYRSAPSPRPEGVMMPRRTVQSGRRDDGAYEVLPNENYWIISEKMYGTGVYFRALAEHNRSKAARPDKLAPGMVISTPPVTQLEQTYPDLCPSPSRRDSMRTRAAAVSTVGYTGGGRTYMVQEGDTLSSIAHHELGKTSRWAEIYELNRDALGKDFNYLTPGLRLVLPNRDAHHPERTARQNGNEFPR